MEPSTPTGRPLSTTPPPDEPASPPPRPRALSGGRTVEVAPTADSPAARRKRAREEGAHDAETGPVPWRERAHKSVPLDAKRAPGAAEAVGRAVSPAEVVRAHAEVLMPLAARLDDPGLDPSELQDNAQRLGRQLRKLATSAQDPIEAYLDEVLRKPLERFGRPRDPRALAISIKALAIGADLEWIGRGPQMAWCVERLRGDMPLRHMTPKFKAGLFPTLLALASLAEANEETFEVLLEFCHPRREAFAELGRRLHGLEAPHGPLQALIRVLLRSALSDKALLVKDLLKDSRRSATGELEPALRRLLLTTALQALRQDADRENLLALGTLVQPHGLGDVQARSATDETRQSPTCALEHALALQAPRALDSLDRFNLMRASFAERPPSDLFGEDVLIDQLKSLLERLPLDELPAAVAGLVLAAKAQGVDRADLRAVGSASSRIARWAGQSLPEGPKLLGITQGLAWADDPLRVAGFEPVADTEGAVADRKSAEPPGSAKAGARPRSLSLWPHEESDPCLDLLLHLLRVPGVVAAANASERLKEVLESGRIPDLPSRWRALEVLCSLTGTTLVRQAVAAIGADLRRAVPTSALATDRDPRASDATARLLQAATDTRAAIYHATAEAHGLGHLMDGEVAIRPPHRVGRSTVDATRQLLDFVDDEQIALLQETGLAAGSQAVPYPGEEVVAYTLEVLRQRLEELLALLKPTPSPKLPWTY